MYKVLFPACLLSVFIFSYCNTAKKATAAIVTPKYTYEADVKQIISANCSPCHFPDKGGNKPPLNDYATVNADAANIISRIELHPGDKGFMPFKRARLSDSLINIIKQWKADGALEKYK